MSEQTINNTRRKLLQGLGATGLAAVAAPTLAGTSSKDTQWDKTYDFVIIGSGFAALAAAIEAKKQGIKSVAIFEQMPTFGGNSSINGGLFAVPGSPMQKKEGVKDSVDQMVADQIKSGRGIADEALLRHVAEHANEALQMTFDAGAEYLPYLQQLGGHSAPRTYQTTVACGAGITQPLYKMALSKGVEMNKRCRMSGFIRGKDGAIEGVTIETRYYADRKVSEGETLNVRARTAVLVATGGFSQNIALRMAQDPTLTSDVGCTNIKGATGEAMLEMFRIGAVPVHLAHIQSGPWASPDEGGFGYVSNYSIFNFPHSIAVSRLTGQRFMNEIADRKTRADAELSNRDAEGNPVPPLMITHYHDADKHPNCKKVLKYGVGWKFDTLEDLAKHFDVPLKPLKAQIEEYNRYVDSGVDEQFGKPMGEAKGKHIKAPFMVVRLWPKVHYCQGGVKVNQMAQVEDSLTGKPIKGLLAAGEVAGGIHGVSRLGSCSIPECMVMGITAARTAAAGKA
ncbi:flavocytochrome c [Ferrimonas balearica]|uniref:flavocytochrome c n=1 Tax=Ferrimonas balearica TaxID=44012 RepID=UPI001C59266A|nr:flavocytochrome c [Ferrimonas balearica]MBW3165461.1 flavocytochrome c [Ferrimonas balearica]MBY6107641.1 flavocytochrome c [Ferrimonas balearica]MBY6226641.1 flavocytochrome c [Ferrimonas balearica]